MPFSTFRLYISLKLSTDLTIVEPEHLISAHSHEVSPIPPLEVLLKLLDGADREVGLGDVHDVVPVPAGLQQLPHPLQQQEQHAVAAPEGPVALPEEPDVGKCLEVPELLIHQLTLLIHMDVVIVMGTVDVPQESLDLPHSLACTHLSLVERLGYNLTIDGHDEGDPDVGGGDGLPVCPDQPHPGEVHGQGPVSAAELH